MLAKVHAVLYRLSIDRDGETRIQLDVPLNELPEAAKLNVAIHQVMEVTFTLVTSGIIGGRRVDSEEGA